MQLFVECEEYMDNFSKELQAHKDIKLHFTTQNMFSSFKRGKL